MSQELSKLTETILGKYLFDVNSVFHQPAQRVHVQCCIQPPGVSLELSVLLWGKLCLSWFKWVIPAFCSPVFYCPKQTATSVWTVAFRNRVDAAGQQVLPPHTTIQLAQVEKQVLLVLYCPAFEHIWDVLLSKFSYLCKFHQDGRLWKCWLVCLERTCLIFDCICEAEWEEEEYI